MKNNTHKSSTSSSTTAMYSNKGRKGKFKHNLAKKTDEPVDEESQSFMERQTLNDNNQRVDRLEKQVSAIKGITMGLSN